MYTSQSRFVDSLTSASRGKNTQQFPSHPHPSHTHAYHIHTHPQESAKHLGPDTVLSTSITVKKVGFLLYRPRVGSPLSSTFAQCHPNSPWPRSGLYFLQLFLPKFKPLYHNTLLTKLHTLMYISQITQSTHPTPSPPHSLQEELHTSPKESPPKDEEVLHTFTILEIHNAPDNTSRFELVMFLDAGLAHSSAPSVTPTFLNYEYNQMELGNRPPPPRARCHPPGRYQLL